MPIVLPGAEPVPAPPTTAEEVRQTSEPVAATNENESTDDKPKRRTKKQLIADAEVPTDGTKFEMKDKATGSKVEREWPEAARLFLVDNGKTTDFVDTADRYKALKWAEQQAATAPAPASAVEQQREEDPALEIEVLTQNWVEGQKHLDEHSGENPAAESALEEMRQQIISLGGEDPASDEAYEKRAGLVFPNVLTTESAPPDAEVGDEVCIGSETFLVGHGGVLTTSAVGNPNGTHIKPRRRWQRELGTGGKGAWEIRRVYEGNESTPPVDLGAFAATNVADADVVIGDDGKVLKDRFGSLTPGATVKIVPQQESEQLKPGEAQREYLAPSMQQIGVNTWRVGTGLLEKIGLPEYSALQIGPITASQTNVAVTNDEIYEYTRSDGRVARAPKQVVDAILECGDAVEIAARIIRNDALSFLAAAKPGSVDMSRGGGAKMG